LLGFDFREFSAARADSLREHPADGCFVHTRRIAKPPGELKRARSSAKMR
jgi:hypothetical protein